MHDLQLAYRFYSQVTDKGFTKKEFQRIVRNLTKIQLADDQVSVLFELFDGMLRLNSMVKVMGMDAWMQWSFQRR
jgi:hypothetical protein